LSGSQSSGTFLMGHPVCIRYECVSLYIGLPMCPSYVEKADRRYNIITCMLEICIFLICSLFKNTHYISLIRLVSMQNRKS